MNSPPLSERMAARARPIWDREMAHPFVRGLADGALSVQRFRFYLRQDYLFLIDYCRVFALAVAKAREMAQVEFFATLLHETLYTEMELHRDYCRRLGIESSDLERTAPTPVTHAYTRHLLLAAHDGSLAEIIAAVLPCQLGYAEISAALTREYPGWRTSLYAEWIRTYTSPDFVAGAERLRAMLDEMTAQWPETLLVPLEEIFLTSSRYEYLFWEMAYTGADWPV